MEQLTFIEPAPFAPHWPTPGSLADLALGWLLAGEVLDSPSFQTRTGSWRAAAYVRELRNLGWPVLSEPAALPSAGRADRRIARYCLPPGIAPMGRALRGGGA